MVLMRGLTKRARVILFLAGFAGVAAGVEPPIEFSGVLVEKGRPKIAVTDKATKTTRWVDPGAVFNGYTITRYVANEDAIVLRKDGQEYRLLLVPPKTGAASTTPPSGSAPPAAVIAPLPPVAAPVVAATPSPPVTTPSSNPGAASGPAAGSASAGAVPASPSSLPPTGTVLAPEPPATGVTATAPASAATPPPSPGATGSAAVTRAVAPGDTVESIAGKSGLSVPQLKALNPTLNEGSLQPGQVIRIQ